MRCHSRRKIKNCEKKRRNLLICLLTYLAFDACDGER